jgi:hypothetical protein
LSKGGANGGWKVSVPPRTNEYAAARVAGPAGNRCEADARRASIIALIVGARAPWSKKPMSRDSSPVLAILCTALALLALVGTWGHNIDYLDLGFLGANARFWSDTLVNPASRSITADIFALALPVFYWMIAEARRLSMRGAWLYVVGSILVAISVALPVFILHRARVLGRAGEQPAQGRLNVADWIGMCALSMLTLGYVAWSFSAKS